ncbi:PLD-like domain-containing protein [Roseomonas rosea]|uniref:Phospholipase D n=1 Tax=Muricoccus roseus TaxID=198092 RepID=A0A1M6PS91_9PROT|nr:phospholipase D-like domain-containing protein [Roseomonas rosea]SHK10805.1 PLD-like domain-containing protein [Roseomonas rosea]
MKPAHDAVEFVPTIAWNCCPRSLEYALLASGVKLFELRRLPENGDAGGGRAGLFGSATASLHAKTFVVDRERIFVGSFNFDPRSAELNTALGFVIDSPRLAGALADAFEASIPERAYELELEEGDQIVWLGNKRAGSLLDTATAATIIGKERKIFAMREMEEVQP